MALGLDKTPHFSLNIIDFFHQFNQFIATSNDFAVCYCHTVKFHVLLTASNFVRKLKTCSFQPVLFPSLKPLQEFALDEFFPAPCHALIDH